MAHLVVFSPPREEYDKGTLFPRLYSPSYQMSSLESWPDQKMLEPLVVLKLPEVALGLPILCMQMTWLYTAEQILRKQWRLSHVCSCIVLGLGKA